MKLMCKHFAVKNLKNMKVFKAMQFKASSLLVMLSWMLIIASHPLIMMQISSCGGKSFLISLRCNCPRSKSSLQKCCVDWLIDFLLCRSKGSLQKCCRSLYFS